MQLCERVIVCLNSDEPFFPLKEAIWAFDILRFLHPNLRLVIASGGDDAWRVEKFARDMETTEQVRFVSGWRDLKAALANAAVAWITNPGEEDPMLVENALAAGVPIVAVPCPAVRGLFVDGANGWLVPGGNKPVLAKKTHQLLSAKFPIRPPGCECDPDVTHQTHRDGNGIIPDAPAGL